MTGPNRSLSALVVNFNAGHSLVDCVGSLLDFGQGIEVCVIDNASTDGSPDLLESRLGDAPALEIRRNAENIGFARAVNLWAKGQLTDFLLVVNPDCTLPPHSLERLLDALSAVDGAGLAAPRVLDARGRVEAASLRAFPRPLNSLSSVTGLSRLGRWIPSLRGVNSPDAAGVTEVVSAEAVSGACMLLRRSALERVGYLDEAYGMHCEDLDLMYRLRQQGWHCLYVATATATHLQGLSSRSRPMWVHLQKHRGMQRFYGKFLAAEYGRGVAALVTFGIWLRFLILAPLAWIRR